MGVRAVVWQAVQIAAIVVVVALVAGQLLGQPILLSFVTSGSMEPTLGSGDGFVALPPELAGSLGEGDVVVFESEEIDGGGLTTHRIVGEREDGFVTQGDANPFTDQDSGEPPVPEPKIVAVAWQPGGELAVIPGLGTAVTGIQSVVESGQRRLAQLVGTRELLGTQGIAYLLFGASILLYVVGGWLEDDKQRTRNTGREAGLSSRQLMLGLTLLLLAGATAAMVVPAGVHDFGIVSAEFESDSPDVIQQGTSESFQYEVRNGGVVPTVVLLEPASPQVGADPSRLDLSTRAAENATITITAPPETGYYQVFLEERRYFAILPTPTIESLSDLHPWLPILAIDLLLGVPFYLFGIRLIGTGRLRSRARNSSSSSGLFW